MGSLFPLPVAALSDPTPAPDEEPAPVAFDTKAALDEPAPPLLAGVFMRKPPIALLKFSIVGVGSRTIPPSTEDSFPCELLRDRPARTLGISFTACFALFLLAAEVVLVTGSWRSRSPAGSSSSPSSSIVGMANAFLWFLLFAAAVVFAFGFGCAFAFVRGLDFGVSAPLRRTLTFPPAELLLPAAAMATLRKELPELAAPPDW
mmetsp:Transcript_16432/g.40636  ORF Transcript_16432/g.40636 Transcript_16432/m.40636 type:complete len:204 (+) Transcript_16432:551-1162(+)